MQDKQWTKQECQDLVNETMAEYGIEGVEFYTRDRKDPGVCRFSLKPGPDGKLAKKQIGMANYLWTGRLFHRGRWLTNTTGPGARLWTLLHEMAHMILAVFERELGADVGRETPHGKHFQEMETDLCLEYGWKPVYTRCPGYSTHHKNIETGEKFESSGLGTWKVETQEDLAGIA